MAPASATLALLAGLEGRGKQPKLQRPRPLPAATRVQMWPSPVDSSPAHRNKEDEGVYTELREVGTRGVNGVGLLLRRSELLCLQQTSRITSNQRQRW